MFDGQQKTKIAVYPNRQYLKELTSVTNDLENNVLGFLYCLLLSGKFFFLLK